MQSPNPYDEVPYLGRVHPTTSPLHLALVSLLHGGPTPAVEQYRLMDLGCGDGANLIPLAFYNPDCEFVGVDNSHLQITAAMATARELKLANIRFEHRDVRDLTAEDFGQFDYVVAHGLFSWIPDDARRAVLSFCQKSLTSNGLAYICYNAMPGWGIRGLLRDLLLRSEQVRKAPIREQAMVAQSLIREYYEDLPSREYAYGDLMAREFEYLLSATPFYLQHEYLAENNQAFWLSEFVHLATEYGLAYVGDAQYGKPEGRLPQGVEDTLAERHLSQVEREERVDLLSQRALHTSILCLNGAPRNSIPREEVLNSVFVASDLSAMSDPFQLKEGVVESFKGRSEVEITLEESITKAAMIVLATAWPGGLKFDILLRCAERILNDYGLPLPDRRQEILAEEITELFSLGEVSWRLKEPDVASVADVLPNPRIHALAKCELSRSSILTTPHHLPLPLEPEPLAVLRKINEEPPQIQNGGTDKHILSFLVRWGLVR